MQEVSYISDSGVWTPDAVVKNSPRRDDRRDTRVIRSSLLIFQPRYEVTIVEVSIYERLSRAPHERSQLGSRNASTSTGYLRS